MNLSEYQKALKRKINFDNIPQYFKEKPNWVLWKLVKNNDPKAKNDYKKIPFNIDEQTGEIYTVSSNDPNTWDTFENVRKHYETLSEVAGIWFAIDDDCLFFLDIDGVKDHYLIDELSGVTYGELSPSQEGYHFFLQSSEPFNHKKKDSTGTLEVYSGVGRFASFTGFTIDDDASEVIKDDERVKEIIKNHFETDSDEKPIVLNFDDINKRKSQCNLSVEEILDIAKNNKYRGEDYTAIIEGRFEDARNYKGESFVDEKGDIDISRADFSLMQEIAGITKGDREKMFEVYRNTPGWYRKDNDHNVGRIGNTIDTAITKYLSKNKFKDIEEKRKNEEFLKNIDYNSWWYENEEGKKKFLHEKMGEYIINFYHAVLYKNNTYIYDDKEGYYKLDDTGIMLKRIIRSLEISLTNKQVSEVFNYVVPMATVIEEKEERLIAVKNGLLDPYTKKLIDFSPDYFITEKIDTNYNPSAHDDFIENTFVKITQGHSPTIRNIYEMYASILYPNFLVERLFYLLGKTADNGKSTILNIARETFENNGDISAVELSEIMGDRHGTAGMDNKKANIVDDLPKTTIKDAGVLKSMITGGVVNIRDMRKKGYSVKWRSPLIVASNYDPDFDENGDEIKKRLYVIPFNYSFKNDENALSVRQMSKKISEDSAKEHVLKYTVDALHTMLKRVNQREILTFNDKVQEELNRFEKQNSPVISYKEEVFNHFTSERIPQEFVYYSYTHWAKNIGMDNVLGRNEFIDRFERTIENEFIKKTRTRLGNDNYQKLARDMEELTFTPTYTKFKISDRKQYTLYELII